MGGGSIPQPWENHPGWARIIGQGVAALRSPMLLPVTLCSVSLINTMVPQRKL